MRGQVVVLGCLLAPAVVGAQTPDTTDWRSYVPLEVGNAWQYLVTDEIGSGHYGYQVTHDTTIEGRQYVSARYCTPTFCFEGSPTNPNLDLRYDTDFPVVLEWVQPTSGPPADRWWRETPCALDAPFDSFTMCSRPGTTEWVYLVTGGPGYELVMPPDTIRGVTYKQFEALPVVMGAVAGVGIVSRQYTKSPPFASERMIWARIGEAEYGTQAFSFPPVTDVSEVPTSSWEDVITVAPNPGSGRARVSLFLPREGLVRVELSDLVGRSNLAFDLGYYSMGPISVHLDLEAVPPGVYVLSVFVAGYPVGVRLITIAR